MLPCIRPTRTGDETALFERAVLRCRVPGMCRGAVVARSRAREAVESVVLDNTPSGFMYISRSFGCTKGVGLRGLKSSEVRETNRL